MYLTNNSTSVLRMKTKLTEQTKRFVRVDKPKKNPIKRYREFASLKLSWRV